MPNLLATKRGRLAAFFFLYLSEGVPLGFTATAIATQMRRQGVGVAEVGAFVASLYLPWAFKWAFGPLVDVLSWERFGRRRMWIVLAQAMMAATLLAAWPIDFAGRIGLFTAFLLVHNTFAAIQDVAIDSLAVNVLGEDERGLANGLMFAGSYVGFALGGSGVLFLASVVPFRATYPFVSGSVLLVTLLVALPLQEPRGAAGPAPGPALGEIGERIRRFLADTLRAFTRSRGALIGILFALLPPGAYALGLALQSNLAVELGMSDRSIGWLGLWSTAVTALACVGGGWLSDRFGRRRMLALFITGMSGPTLYLALALERHGWVWPRDPQALVPPEAPAELLAAFWAATLAYAVFNGLMYGTCTALFMDVTTRAVAASQFTAYMALSNLVYAYSARWQGVAAERWGYPATLGADALFGLVSLALLPLMVGARRAGDRQLGTPGTQRLDSPTGATEDRLGSRP